MIKRRVALLSDRHLLGESLEHTLRHFEDVEVIGAWALDEQVLSLLSAQTIDLLLIAEREPPGEEITFLTGQILETYPNLPVIRVTLDQNVLRIYTSQTLPARTAQLIDVIRHLPIPRDDLKDQSSR
jgi:DNA-binding NarL/FixJ family response regulator